jgi:hypothetical protein
MKTYTINRTFQISEEEARLDAFYAAGRAIGIIVYKGGHWMIQRVTIEPGPEDPVWLDECASSTNDYDFCMGRLARARISGNFSGHANDARSVSLGRDAIEDLLRFWSTITLVAEALLKTGDLNQEQLAAILPESFLTSATEVFESRFERWYATA